MHDAPGIVGDSPEVDAAESKLGEKRREFDVTCGSTELGETFQLSTHLIREVQSNRI